MGRGLVALALGAVPVPRSDDCRRHSAISASRSAAAAASLAISSRGSARSALAYAPALSRASSALWQLSPALRRLSCSVSAVVGLAVSPRGSALCGLVHRCAPPRASFFGDVVGLVLWVLFGRQRPCASAPSRTARGFREVGIRMRESEVKTRRRDAKEEKKRLLHLVSREDEFSDLCGKKPR